MREILFRAYDKGRKEYLSDGHLFIAINKSRRPSKSKIYLDVISNADKYKERFVIEQYTGLIDKNGTKIFEGDIVKDGVLFGKVVYATPQDGFDGIAGFMVDDVYDGLQNYNSFWHQVEVIGNIHDNPELLKGGAE